MAFVFIMINILLYYYYLVIFVLMCIETLKTSSFHYYYRLIDIMLYHVNQQSWEERHDIASNNYMYQTVTNITIRMRYDMVLLSCYMIFSA